MLGLKRNTLLVNVVIVIVILGLSSQLSLAQFIPCRIVNLKLTLPDVVQAGQPFQITTTLTISCDPSVLPVVRVDLVDASTSKILTTTSMPYYPSSSSFIVPVVSQTTARSSSGSWGLQVQAYVINGVNDATAASSSQLFQLNVTPYTSPVTIIQTNSTTTQVLNISSAASYSSQSTSTNTQENQTQLLQTSQTTFSTSTTPDFTSQLLPAAALVLVALVIFALLFYGASELRVARMVNSARNAELNWTKTRDFVQTAAHTEPSRNSLLLHDVAFRLLHHSRVTESSSDGIFHLEKYFREDLMSVQMPLKSDGLT